MAEDVVDFAKLDSLLAEEDHVPKFGCNLESLIFHPLFNELADVGDELLAGYVHELLLEAGLCDGRSAKSLIRCIRFLTAFIWVLISHIELLDQVF